MKLFIALLLVCNCCFAQKIIVKDQQGKALENVSVYALAEQNNLIGITSASGESNLLNSASATYLFHLVGYTDVILTASALEQKQGVVLLSQVIIPLKEVTISKKSGKLRSKKIAYKPRVNYLWGFPNNFKTTIDKVIAVAISEAGYVKQFTLSIRNENKQRHRSFQLVIFENSNGKPGKSLMSETVIGELIGTKMVFTLTPLNMYLADGHYFFGFETIPSQYFDQEEAKKMQKGAWVGATIQIKCRADETQNSYIRSNLKAWNRIKIAMQYELELLIPAVN
ncbi:MAG: hypothetical protein EOO07_05060 [Chitinophagaceae bacterium]|nr:MAG: hypothetical protein EOO07_05060 [Chitinophagaceae bacterium]